MYPDSPSKVLIESAALPFINKVNVAIANSAASVRLFVKLVAFNA